MSDTIHDETHAGVAEHGLRAVCAHLDAHGVHYEVLAHRATETSGREARALHADAAAVAKTVVVREGAATIIAVVPASRRLDVEALQRVLGAPEPPRLATEAEIAERFPQVDVGAVPPVGPVLAATVVIDATLMERRLVVIHGGDHEHAIALAPDAIRRLADARVAPISLLQAV